MYKSYYFLVVFTSNARVIVLDINSGNILWEHEGIDAQAGLLVGASPSLVDRVLVVPFPSGDVRAFRLENGFILWEKHISRAHYQETYSSLSNVLSTPVIAKGKVYLSSFGNGYTCLNLRDGKIIWQKD